MLPHEGKSNPAPGSATTPLTSPDASLLELGVRTAIRNDVEFYRAWTKNEFNRYNKKSKLKFYEYYCASCGAVHKLFIPPKWIAFNCRICDRTEFTKKIDEVSNEFSKAGPARKMMQEYCAGCGNMQRVFAAKVMGQETKCKVCGRKKFVKRMKELPWMERSLRSR
jgi:ribosomal protein S27E